MFRLDIECSDLFIVSSVIGNKNNRTHNRTVECSEIVETHMGNKCFQRLITTVQVTDVLSENLTEVERTRNGIDNMTDK